MLSNPALQLGGEILPNGCLGDEMALPWICPICNSCPERWAGHPTLVNTTT